MLALLLALLVPTARHDLRTTQAHLTAAVPAAAPASPRAADRALLLDAVATGAGWRPPTSQEPPAVTADATAPGTAPDAVRARGPPPA